MLLQKVCPMMPEAQALWCENCSVCGNRFCTADSSRSNKYIKNNDKVITICWAVSQEVFKKAKTKKHLSQANSRVKEKEKKKRRTQ